MDKDIDVHKVFAKHFTGCESLAYALSSRLAEGNICVRLEEYKQQLTGLLAEQAEKESFDEKDEIFWTVEETFERQCHDEIFVGSPGEVKPFIIDDGRAYLQRYFEYETQIIENIKRLGKNFRIITGGPGTGKTYSVSLQLIEFFNNNPDLKVALAAPTGKAAARMNQSIREFAENPENVIQENSREKLTGLKAKTIHRLLGTIPNSVFFRHDNENLLPYDIIIIDECSMIDVPLLAKLLTAVRCTTRLYLLGDKDQLASVEAGSAFGDLCRANHSDLLKDKIAILTKSYRFDENKGIGKLSRQVISGKADPIEEYKNDDQITIDSAYSNELFIKYASMYEEYIKEVDIKEALKKLNYVRFLCVTRENDWSVSLVNKKIAKYLTDKIPSFFAREEGFYENQPIIITQNDYKLDVFNGDVGIIRKKTTKDGEQYIAYFEKTDGTIKEIAAGYLNNYETVFAMTIHKSQGSEFENVAVILPEHQGKKLLTRELLYTAISRAKKSVLIQSTKESLYDCIDKKVSRASGLEERIKN